MTTVQPTDDKVFLLDAYAIIYRSYYAFLKNPRINSKGVNTSAIFGFVNILDELIRNEKPEYIAIVFDPGGKTFRHETYEEYKAQRQKTPEDIKNAIPYIKRIIEAYGIGIFEMEGYEADDVIGTMAKRLQGEGFGVYMMTPDKDYAQLVDTNIFQYKPRYGSAGFDVLGVEEIKAKYGLDSPAQMIDLLGLMGDASDNIPGCPGVGEKTATKLIKDFGSIDNLLHNTDKLTGALKTKVVQNREQIVLSRFLATIKTDIPIDLSIEDIKRKPSDTGKMRELFTELEFRTLLHRHQLGDIIVKQETTSPTQGSLFDTQAKEQTSTIQKATNESPKDTTDIIPTLKTINDTRHEYILIQTDDEIDRLIEILGSHSAFCFDTETTSLDTFEAQIVGLSFAVEPQKAYYVALPDDRQKTEEILRRFAPLLEDASIEKTGQNMKYDISVLGNYGIGVGGRMFDTMIAHYLLQPELRHNMDYMAEVFLGYRTIHFGELFDDDKTKKSGKPIEDIRKVELGKLKDYACEDADITLQLRNIFQQKLCESSLENLFFDIEMPLVPILAKMESNGVLIDDFALASYAETLKRELQKIERDILAYVDLPINISSPKQIGELLFERLRIVEKPSKTKTGQYRTDEETLQKLRNRHPIIKLILEHRGLKKLLSTYVEALPKLINPKTNKIHTSFNQTVVSTGRLSSSNPNLQNIPVRDDYGREIRKAFIAEPGCVLLSADYSQVELRIMAHLSGDRNMLSAFASGQDIHAATAARIFKVPIEEVTADMRRKAKTANFGIIYGISAFGLSERLDIPRKEAAALIDGYFESFPDVKRYMEQAIEEARRNGFVQTLFGRKLYLPDINSQNASVRGFAERIAINAPIQGTAADIIKIAMIKVDEAIRHHNYRSQMMLQVHDELVFNVPTEEVDEFRQSVKHAMETAASLRVPLIVDVGIGHNWLEAH